MDSPGHKSRRMSMARAAAENVLTVLRGLGLPVDRHDLHINFPGGTPVDGPSAGVSMAIAAYSAIMKTPVHSDIAMTGELSVLGEILPVGGVPVKIAAAEKASMKRVLIPLLNKQERYKAMNVEVIPISTLREALDYALGESPGRANQKIDADTLAAEGN